MASQPLETIPEEPTPAPTPTPARVTAETPQTKPAKNPGRVESGKRLAEFNRRARGAKKQAQAASASNPTASASNTTTATASNTTTATASDNNNNLSFVTVLGIVGLIVSMLGVYYQREAIKARFNPAPPAQPAPAPTPAPSRIPVKQGIKKME